MLRSEHARGSAGSLVEEVVAQDRPPAPVPRPRVQLNAALLHVQRAAHMVIPASGPLSSAATPAPLR